MKYFISGNARDIQRHVSFVVLLLAVLLLSLPWNTNISSWASVLFSVLLLTTARTGVRVSFGNASLVPIMAYYVYTAASVVFIANDSSELKSVLANSPFLTFPIVVSAASRQLNGRVLSKLLLTYALGIMIAFTTCLILALYQFWGDFYLVENGYYPVTSLIGMHPSYFSLFTSFACIIFIDFLVKNYYRLRTSVRIMLLGLVAYSGFAVLYIRSRAGIISFIAVILFVIYYELPPKYRLTTGLTFAGILLSVYLTIHFTGFHTGRFQIQQLENAIELKKRQWQASINIIVDHPIFGVTTARAQDRLDAEYDRTGFSEGKANRFNSHNQFLTTLLEGGIVGLVLLFTPMVTILAKGFKEQNIIKISFVLLTLLAFLTESMLDRHKGIVFFAVFTALFACWHHQTANPPIFDQADKRNENH